MPPRKSKGRGKKGTGRGRERERQQESRPGRTNETESTENSVSELRPSLSQAPPQPKCPPTSPKKEQKPEVVNPTSPTATSLSQPSSKAEAPSDLHASHVTRNTAVQKQVVCHDQGNTQFTDVSGDDSAPKRYKTQATSLSQPSSKAEAPSDLHASHVTRNTAVQKQVVCHDQGSTQFTDVSGDDSAPKRYKTQGSATSSSAVESLADEVASVKIAHATSSGCSSEKSELHPPLRPDFGTAGRSIALLVNFFRLKVPQNLFLYHYDVEIEPSKCPRSVKHRVIDTLLDRYSERFRRRRPAFDGQKNIYSREKLPVGKDGMKLEIELADEDGGKSRKFKVTIKFAAYVNISELTDFVKNNKGGMTHSRLPQECIQSLDIVLRQKPNLNFTPVGRSFFPPPDSKNNRPGYLGGGCEVWSGYYQSVRPSQWKTMLVNIDVAAKGFYKEQDVIELLCETLRKQEAYISDRRFQMDRYMKDEFTQAIKGLRIVATHIKEFKRKYTVKGLSRYSASTLSFSITDGKTSRTTTVENYFLDRYQIRLRYPHLPCLDVGQDKYMPMEVCRLIPCPKRKLTDEQIAEMIKHTATPAWKRKKEIEKWAAECEQKSGTYLRDEFGMAMSTQMERVEGRVLDPPAIKLGAGSKELKQHSGFWDMREKTFFKSENKIKSWAMFCYVNKQQCNADILRNFSDKLMLFSGKAGMKILTGPCFVGYIRKDQTNNEFDTVLKKHPELQLIVAVLPDKGNKDIYEQVKQVGDVILGVATSCVQFKQVRVAKPQVCSNLAMKINAKMGGINHVPVNPGSNLLLNEPIIIIGADVTHPSAGDTRTPSIAAVVASLDANASRYCATIRVQDHRQEIIGELAAMVKELLKQFFTKTRRKPRKIFFYRDGVSEGQFDQVLKYEVRAVQQACLELETDYNYQPGITFVVVQKRHHIRLFPVNKENETGKQGNVPPGTTVDQGITHPFEFDFYLCSHYGIQGTSKPTHYHVIYDDNSFTADSLQRLTYQLCHTFARCPRSVSMPAPAYYAHLAAFRARNHLARILRSSDGSVADNLKAFSDAVRVKNTMASEMYFI